MIHLSLLNMTPFLTGEMKVPGIISPYVILLLLLSNTMFTSVRALSFQASRNKSCSAHSVALPCVLLFQPHCLVCFRPCTSGGSTHTMPFCEVYSCPWQVQSVFGFRLPQGNISKEYQIAASLQQQRKLHMKPERSAASLSRKSNGRHHLLLSSLESNTALLVS